jgi:hypothetical protein
MPEAQQQKLFEFNGYESSNRLARTLDINGQMAELAVRQSQREYERLESERLERIARAGGSQILAETATDPAEIPV